MILNIDFFSDALQKNTRIDIFLDENVINENTESMEVIYLCHGYGGDGQSWEKHTRLTQFILGKPILAVALSADNSFYLPNFMGFDYESYVLEDVPKLLKFLFPNITQKNNIVGLSMGGYGAMRMALLYPDKFNKVGIFSTVADIKELEQLHRLQKLNLKQLLDDNENIDLFELAENNQQFPKEVFQMCGLLDPYLKMNKRFYETMKSNGASISFTTIDGGHDWIFWNNALEVFINKFFSQSN